MPRIWGSHSLAPMYADKTNLIEPLGEAWLTGPLCEIETGPLTGCLNPAWRAMPVEWRGTDFVSRSDFPDFPLLVKFIFPSDRLSIQVHPDDAYAKQNEAPDACGKTEMWYAVSADPGAKLLLGLGPAVNRKLFLEAIEQRTLEHLLQPWPVSAGDTFYVPAGTPHTIGPGMVLCEVQQSSDFTYRLYDYERLDGQSTPRQLHIDKALAVIDFDHRKGGKVSPLTLASSEGVKKTLLVACPYFVSELWDLSVAHHAKSDPSRFELLVILSGGGNIQWSGGSRSYRQGECWFVPAELGQFSLLPGNATSLLRAYVPNVGQLRAQLVRHGIPDSAIEEVFFS